jgi:SAM-dependent methyltransferase
MLDKKKIKDILQWDICSWSKALYFWEEKMDWSEAMVGLELGGREGGLSLWLADNGVKVICSDLENVKLTAEPIHLAHKVSNKISYQDIDATNIPYENHFDVIVFKSIIGGIGSGNNYEKQVTVFKQIYKALKPGGKLLFAENLVASPFHQKLRQRFVNWGQSWRYISITEMENFLNDFKKKDINSTGVFATFGRNETQRNFLAKMDKMIFNYICPKNWKYIVYGVAEK